MINNSNINNKSYKKPKKVIDNVMNNNILKDASIDLQNELFNNIEDIIYICDENYKIISANNAFIKKYGNDYVNKKCHEILFKCTKNCTWCQLSNVKQTNETCYIDHYNSIDECWNEIKFSCIKNESNQNLYLIIIHNINNRKLLEENILETSLKFQTITDIAHDAIIMINSKGNINYWNTSAERIFGYTKEEMTDQNVHKILAPPQYHKEINKNFPKFQLTGSGNALNKTLELTALNKNKEEINVELSVSALKLKGETHALAVIRDITERKQLELREKRHQQELKETNEELEIMRFSVENSALAAIWIDSEANILKTNKKLSEISGYTEEELSKLTIFDVDNTLTKEGWKSFWEACYQHTTTVIEAAITRKDGYTFPIEVSGKYQEFKGKKYVFVNAKDITERKRVKELLTEQNEELLNYKEILEETIEVMEKSESKYSGLFENMSEGMLIGQFIYDKDGNPTYIQVLDINPAYETICSVTKEEAINSLFSELHKNEDIPFWDQMIEVVINKEAICFKTYWEYLDKYLKIVLFPLENDQFALVISDITLLRISEDKLNQEIHEMQKKEKALISIQEKLTRQKDNYYKILEKMDFATSVIELVYNKNAEAIDVKILYINKAYEEHKLCKRENYVGKIGKAIFGSEHPFLHHFVEVVETAETKIIEHFFHPTNKHYKIEINYLEDSKLVVFSSEITGKILAEQELQHQQYIQKHISDELEETRHRLLENIAYFESLINGIKESAYICADDYTIEFANNAFIEKVGGFLPSEKCYKIIYDRDTTCPWCKHEECNDKETVLNSKIELDNHNLTREMLFSPIFQLNHTKSTMIIMYDKDQNENAI